MPLDRVRSRVLLFLPTRRDAELTSDILARHDIDAVRCEDDGELLARLDEGAGAVLLAEELLTGSGASLLREVLRRQPRWSDLPILLLARTGADSDAVGEAIAHLGNVTLLERPLRLATLVSTVRAALRARSRQYQIELHLQALEHARAIEEEGARRKDQFLAMLAHELRNPLAPIGTALQVLEMDDSDPQRRHRLQKMMQRQLDHLVRLVDDLLEASRLSQGKIELECKPQDLRAILAECVDLASLEQQDLTLRGELGGEPLPVHADRVRLCQVFANLLNNARKYARPGGTIVVSARREGTQVAVSVADDGIGIAPELLPQVFDLFTQGRREEHKLHDGLGIGLALVRSLVEMHGGTVEARSEGPGRGAEFIVRLPLDPGAVPEATPHPRATAAGRRRVLVVDDNVDAASSLELLLHAMGHDARIAHGGEDALRMARDFAPQVALLDIGMPGMDGYELASRLRREAGLDGLLIAAVTGWGEARDRQRAEDAGFDHHFRKPLAAADLTRLLGGALGA